MKIKIYRRQHGRILGTILIVFMITASGNLSADDPKQIQWDDLIPAGWNPTKVLEEMSDEEFNALSYEDMMKLEKKAQAMLDAAPVIEKLDGLRVKIPGFLLPLEFDSTSLKDFLLVPYFGACVHMPPPPANQIIHGRLKKSIEVADIFSPFWVIGTLRIDRVTSQLDEAGVSSGLAVQSAYSMEVEKIDPYQYEE